MKNHECRFKIDNELKDKLKRIYNNESGLNDLKYNSFLGIVLEQGANLFQEQIQLGKKFKISKRN